MKNTDENLHYLQEKDIEFNNVQNEQTVSKSRNVQKGEKTKEKRSKNRFFLELENEYDELFDNESFVSKRSLKEKKLQEKMSVFSEENFRDEKNECILPCEGDISSISFMNDQGTPDDSIFSKLIKESSLNKNEEFQSPNLEEEFSSQNVSFLNSEMMEDEASEKSFFVSQTSEQNQSSEIEVEEDHKVENNKIENLPSIEGLMNKIDYAFKKSSMQFEKVNKFLLKFLKTTVDGILVLPEYSSRLEDFSELGAEGKMLQLKITQPKKSENYLDMNKILSEELQKELHEEKIEDDDLDEFRKQPKFFLKQKNQENENNESSSETKYKNEFSSNTEPNQKIS